MTEEKAKPADQPAVHTTIVKKEPFHVDWEEVRNIFAWLAGCAMVVLVAWAPVKCSMDGNAKIAEAIGGGANPIDAACAFSSQGSSAPCIVRAAVGEGKAK